MTRRFVSNLAVLAKMETVYKTDPVPTGALNAMQLINATIEPMVGEDLDRELLKPYMGHPGVILDGNYVRISGEIEICGSGAPGTPPPFSPFLRSSGLKEVITAATRVTYTPVSRLFESCTVYYNDDGVNHIMLGARGTLTWQFTPSRIPRFTVTMTGLSGTFSDLPLPVTDLTRFLDPVPVNLANTSLSLHGYAGACEGVTFDLGNVIEPRFLINWESVEQVDRKMTGSAIFEAALLAEKDWLTTAKSHQTGTLAVTHGTVAGNIVKNNAPRVQLGRLTYGATQRIRNNTVPLMFLPTSAGNDETALIFE